MRVFDTSVQELRYKILREIARKEWNGTLLEGIMDIPQIIVPGKKPTMRCCVFKERAICAERVRLAIKTENKSKRVIKALEIACDECPTGGYYVTDSCRSCLSHPCVSACRKKAVTYVHGKGAFIDKTLCVECGQCSKVCPFSAIVSRKRPCQAACKLDAVSSDEEGCAIIDYDKCSGCGQCVYQCPFGAIVDRSNILPVIRMLMGKSYSEKICAVVAPAISSQFTYAKRRIQRIG